MFLFRSKSASLGTECVLVPQHHISVTWRKNRCNRELDGRRESKGLTAMGAFRPVSISVYWLAPGFPGSDGVEERGIWGASYCWISCCGHYTFVSLFVCLFFKGNSSILKATCQGLKWSTLSQFLTII